MLKDLSLARHRVEAMSKVRTFLESVERNSIDTRNSYHMGLSRFQDFLEQSDKYSPLNTESILSYLVNNGGGNNVSSNVNVTITRIDLYELLDDFVSYLIKLNISVRTITSYLGAARSYFGYYDIDVIPSKFRRRVKVPKLYREDEEPIDAADIRKILLSCNNRRLKAFILVLASSAMRAREALAIRLKDIDDSVSLTKIHVRKEYSKTRVARDVYISEASSYLNQWIDFKYRDKGVGSEQWNKKKIPDDLVFSVYSTGKPQPSHVYVKILSEFEKLLTIAGLGELKEGMNRRKITLHSFRRHAKSVISNQVNQDYSEWFLGHSKSPYYTLKEPERREIYATKVMRYLTFLDYSALESGQKSIEEKLAAREQEIFSLKHDNNVTTTTVQTLSDQVFHLTKLVEDLQGKRKKGKRG